MKVFLLKTSQWPLKLRWENKWQGNKMKYLGWKTEREIDLQNKKWEGGNRSPFSQNINRHNEISQQRYLHARISYSLYLKTRGISTGCQQNLRTPFLCLTYRKVQRPSCDLLLIPCSFQLMGAQRRAIWWKERRFPSHQLVERITKEPGNKWLHPDAPA